MTGPEAVDGTTLYADEGALGEAANTGLFTGGDQVGLAAHLTFAEFMTAEWVVAHGLPLPQVRALLTDPTDPGQHVVPQLRQVAAWLATPRTDVFDTVVRAEPDLVLWSDVVQLPADRRPALVDALLDATTARCVVEPEFWQRQPRLGHLAHPGLAAQLAPTIGDRTGPERTRELALDIARACRVGALAAHATELALDGSEPLELRVAAARVVEAAGGDPERLVLSSLLESDLEVDRRDDLKGVVLRACWPLLSPAELFATLTRPKRTNYGGAYGSVLLDIADKLTAEYTRAGAGWLAGGGHDVIYLDRVVVKVLRLTFDALRDAPDPAVSAGVGAYVVGRLRRYRPLVGDLHGDDDDLGIGHDLASNTTLRRRVLAAVVNARPGAGERIGMVAYDRPLLLTGADVLWAIGRLAALPPHDRRRARYREVIGHAFDPGDPAHVAAAFAHPDDPDVTAASRDIARRHPSTEAAVADTAAQRQRFRARQARRECVAAERKRRAEAAAAAAKPGPLPARVRRVREALGASARGWAAVCAELLRDEDGHVRQHLDEARLTALRALPAGDVGEGGVAHLVRLAGDYLRDQAVPDDPFPPGKVWSSVTAGFVALVTLQELAPEHLDALPDAVWRKWLPILAGYWAPDAEEAALDALLHRVAVAVPEDAVAAFVSGLDTQSRAEHAVLHGPLFTVGLSLPAVGRKIVRRVGRGAYEPRVAANLLEQMLRSGSEDALGVARTLLRGPSDPPAGTRGAKAQPELVLASGSALLAAAAAAAWDDLWAYFRRDDAHARALLEYAARDRDWLFGPGADTLTDVQLADTYLLVARLYPPRTDPDHAGTYSPGARDNLRHWRGALLRHLEGRTTAEAVAQLARIAAHEPVRDGLVQLWLRARAALRGTQWRGVSPRHLLELAAGADKRVVESSAQLLAVVVESLGRLQNELQGQWRGVEGLWNEHADGNTPKSEEHLSNAIARHLRRDLGDGRVLVGRELQLQLGVRGGAPGLRTDVEVSAPSGLGAAATDTPRVVIEVKGSWNPEVPTAMRTQLVEAYLAPHAVRAGLYVVGWYTCGSWKAGPKRARSQRMGSYEELAARLDAQAAELTNALRQVQARVLNTALPDTNRGVAHQVGIPRWRT